MARHFENLDDLIKEGKASEIEDSEKTKDENISAAAGENSDDQSQEIDEDLKESSQDGDSNDDVLNEKKQVEKSKKKHGKKADKFSKQERANYAFTKLKNKHKEKVEKLNVEIDELKKNLEKYKLMKKEDFKSEEDFLDAKLNSKIDTRELERKTSELDEARAQKNQAKVNHFYRTDDEKRRYKEVWQLGAKNGILEKIGNDKVLTNFILDSDFSPKLLEHFILADGALERIVHLDDKRKEFELYSLEKRLDAFLNNTNFNKVQKNSGTERRRLTRNNSENSNTNLNETEESGDTERRRLVRNKVKNKNPILGRNIQNQSAKSSKDFASDDDVFAFIRSR